MYRTVSQINGLINLLSGARPDFFTKITLEEESVEGRPIHGIRLHAGSATSRNAVLVLGGTHARELMNPDAIVDLAVDLFISYENGTNLKYGNRTWPASEVRTILDALDIWFVPCTNPDGREYVLNTDELWRKNRRINPNATNQICHGVDINRNADFMWGVTTGSTSCNACTLVYCGPTAASEPETRNIQRLLEARDFVTFLDVHSFAELVLFPWGHAPTQTTDPSKRFTSLATGTCSPIATPGYAEYMTPRDKKRFTTVSRKIVQDIKAVRNHTYQAKPIQGLYACTGTLSDYAYSRHIKSPGVAKTYGFSYETGSPVFVNGFLDEAESFHPADPTPVQKEVKAGIVSLLQQSVCAIELIGSGIFGTGSAVGGLRRFRDELLSKRPQGREWIALYERAQFGLLAAVMKKPKLLAQAGALLRSATGWLKDEETRIPDADVDSALSLIRTLSAATKDRSLQQDLAAVTSQVKAARGRTVRETIERLLRTGPNQKVRPTPGKKVKAKAKRNPRQRKK